MLFSPSPAAATRRWHWSWGLAWACAGLAWVGGCSSGPESAGDTSGGAAGALDPDRNLFGEQLYAQHCAACHGDYGAADGPASGLLFPAARDFTTGQFRLVGTENGVPSDEDLLATLRRGIPGSSMPSWSWLGDAGLHAVVAHVRHLAEEGLALRLERAGLEPQEATSEARARTTPGAPLPALGPIDHGPEALARGKELYRARCDSCHGASGEGALEPRYDDDGGLNWPRDLRAGYLKGGTAPNDLANRIRAGLPGSAMGPTRLARAEDLRDLVAYLSSLIPPGSQDRLVHRRNELVARRVSALPEDAADGAWDRAQRVEVVLAPLWWKDNAILGAQLAALHDGERLSVRIRWQDESGLSPTFPDSLSSDGVAVQFAPVGESSPLMSMGSEDRPTDLWMWRSVNFDEQAGTWDLAPELSAKGFQATEQVDARSYHPALDGREVSSEVTELEGRGLGQAVSTPAHQVDLAAKWEAGSWSVVFTRDFAPEESGVSFSPGDEVNVALAIWNGAAGDRGGQKAISIWQSLTLAP